MLHVNYASIKKSEIYIQVNVQIFVKKVYFFMMHVYILSQHRQKLYPNTMDLSIMNLKIKCHLLERNVALFKKEN